MPDFDKLDQCVMIAKALWFLPPPARAPVAQGMYDLGIRGHPELATMALEGLGSPGLGMHQPQRLVGIKSKREGMDIVRQFAPGMADKMDAATTEREKMLLLKEIRERYPNLIAEAEQKLAAVDPEDLAP